MRCEGENGNQNETWEHCRWSWPNRVKSHETLDHPQFLHRASAALRGRVGINKRPRMGNPHLPPTPPPALILFPNSSDNHCIISIGVTMHRICPQWLLTAIYAIIIVAALAVIAINASLQFSSASREGNNPISSAVQTIRSQIELFKIQHNDHPPRPEAFWPSLLNTD